MQPTEASPLLDGDSEAALLQNTDPEILKHDLFYQRFKPAQKRVIIALISWAGLIPCEFYCFFRTPL